MIKKIPVPMAGLMLGFAALGNLLQSYSESLRMACGAVSVVLGILLLCKCIFYFDQIKEDMKNPITASVSGTFSMAIILLAAYAKNFIGNNAIYIWYFGIGLHIVLICYFTIRFIWKLNIKTVFASYYIVYVGIVTASVSAPAFSKTGLGTAIFWFGIVACLLLFVLITIRYIKYKEIPEPARPLFCITTAPVSLCLAGYVQSVQTKSVIMVVLLLIISQALYVVALTRLPKYLLFPFYPSYSAFTFPFVISATALKMSTTFLVNSGYDIQFLSVAVTIEIVIALCLVIYVLDRYVKFLLQD